jgi:transposase-like protein
VRIAGARVYLWHAVDHEGEVLDILVQRGRDKAAALKLMRRLFKKQGFPPAIIVTDKLRSYAAAFAELGLAARHEQGLRRNKGPKPRTSRSGDASERCSGSSHQDPLSAFSPCMPLSTTRSMFSAIRSPAEHCASSGPRRCTIGSKRRWPPSLNLS